MMATQNYTGTAKGRITVSCSNYCSLSWDSAPELLVEMENSVVGSFETASWQVFINLGAYQLS